MVGGVTLLELIWQSTSLSELGSGSTFTTLGLLVVATVILERVWRTQRIIPNEQPLVKIPTHKMLEQETEDEEIVAAIAIALAQLQSLDRCRDGLGATLKNGHSPWWTVRYQQQPTLRPSLTIQISSSSTEEN